LRGDFGVARNAILAGINQLGISAVVIGYAVILLHVGPVHVAAGNISPAVKLSLQSVVTREIQLIGSCISAGEYPACINLLARGAIRTEPLIGALAPLADGPAWFHRLYNKEPNLRKVILQP